MTPLQRAVLMRMGLCLLIACLLGWAVSEVSFRMLGAEQEHQPQEMLLIIPEGTAERVARGETAVQMPEDLVFFEGDALRVQNNDSVSHQLGPVWVPSGTSGVLHLEKPNQYQLACSFEPNRFLGLDVRPRVTAGVRLQAILAIGLPTGMMLGLYSFVLFPLKKRETQTGEAHA